MAKPLIRFPKDGKTVKVYEATDSTGNKYIYLMATGRLHRAADAVYATCTLTTDITKVVVGKTVALWQYSSPGISGRHLRWAMLFKIPSGDFVDKSTYIIEATGIADGSPEKSDSVTVTLEKHAHARRARAVAISTIHWPGDTDDVSDYEDDFIAYGELYHANPTVTLKYPSGAATQTAITLLYLYADSTIDNIWVAQFDSLPDIAGETYDFNFNDTVTAIPEKLHT